MRGRDVALARSTARRYAEAAFEIAERDDSMAAWLAAFAVADERLTSDEVSRLLANPSVPTTSRVAALQKILRDDITGAPRSLLVLMVRRGRFESLPNVIREFDRLYRLREGIAEATVTSAAQLDETEAAALKARLETMTGKQIELRQAVDPELLGGVQVRVGDRLIDGSVRGRLERLRSDLSTTAI